MKISPEKMVDYYQWILDNGKHYEPGVFRLQKGAKIEKKSCYNNSILYHWMSGLDYVEGFYVTDTIDLPFSHAWNAGPDSKAYDVTAMKFGIPVKERFGVLIPPKVLMKYIEEENDNPFTSALDYFYRNRKKYLHK